MDKELLVEVEKRKNLVLPLKEELFDIVEKHRKNLKVEEKTSNKDLVTPADKEIEEFIFSLIKENFSEDAIIGEEKGETSGSSGFNWYIDPIDGTLAFIQGIRKYGTSIGLVYRGKIVMGIIFFSEDEKTYWAVEGKGAFCEEERIYASNKNKLQEFVVDVGVPSINPHSSAPVFESLKEIFGEIGNIFVLYSCVAGFVYLATGRIDGYWAPQNLSPYDFVAGSLIVKEAGGFVSTYLYPEEFIKPIKTPSIASNGKIHKEFVELINKYYEPKNG